MFREYGRTYRFVVPDFHVPGKTYLSQKEMREILTGHVVIEEKLDGANVAIIRTHQEPGFKLQKRRSLVSHSEHPQYNFFVSWAYANLSKILDIHEGWIVYGELMWAKHHIFYNYLPDYFLCFDVWNGYQYLNYWDRSHFCKSIGLQMVPLVWEGANPQKHHLAKLIPQTSACSRDQKAEGIVIKNYKKQMRGKLVRPEFLKEIDMEKHWMTAPITVNQLAHS